MSRAEVLIPAVKRQLIAVGYYVGAVDQHWDDAAEKAWLMYCERFGYRHSPTPDVYLQEAGPRDVMKKWYDDEEVLQLSQGILPPVQAPAMNIFDIIKQYSEEPPSPSIDDEIVEAQRERGVRPSLDGPNIEAVMELDDQRRSIEDERRRSVRAALSAAKKVARNTMPEELRAFAVEAPPDKPVPVVKRSDKKLKRKAEREKLTTPERQAPLLRVRGGD